MADNFAVKLAQAKVTTKDNIVDFIKKTDFDNKLKHINKSLTSNKAKHAEVGKKLADLKNKFIQISEKGYDFW